MTPKSFRDVINLWPTREALHADLMAYPRRPRGPGRKWKRADVKGWAARDRIPPWWFDAVISAARTRGHPQVTYPLLTALYKAREHRQGFTHEGD